MATRLILAAVLGLAVILLLIIRFKIPAMIAILVGAVLIGLGAGMSFEQIIDSVNDGVGNTLKGIALLVGLGSAPSWRYRAGRSPWPSRWCVVSATGKRPGPWRSPDWSSPCRFSSTPA